MSYTTQTIAQFLAPLGVQRVGETEYPIQWLLTDSRSLSSPEDTLFFALTTPRGDGHRYIPQLYQRGVRSFVVSQVP